jgi:TetR/AcrR family transcriptional regulator, cholesterol catabolism regulator
MSALVEHGDYALAHGRLLAQLPDKARERQIERREQHQQLWHALLQDLRAEGLIRADLDLALCRVFLLGAINSTQAWFDPGKGDLDRVADQLCAVFFEGTRPAPARARPRGRAPNARRVSAGGLRPAPPPYRGSGARRC